jgi:hypothetical protein
VPNRPFDLEPAYQSYYDCLPHKPLVSDDLTYGLRHMPKELAIGKAHIQHNPELIRHFLAFDIDRSDGYSWWEDCGAPAPNYLMLNRENGHAHYLYKLTSFVAFTDRSKPKPRAYLERIERGLEAKLSADVGYVGLISKNPLHDRWTTYTPSLDTYELDELADYVDMTIPKPRKRERTGVGRNCTLFDELRWWAYKHVCGARDSGGFERWLERCISAGDHLNTFNTPLSYSEIKATAKSVAKWTWDFYTGSGGGKNRGRDAKNIEKWQGELDLRDKQALSAQSTNEQRKQSTEQKIKAAIANLKACDKRVTQAAVSRISGVHKVTISRDYKLLFC